MTCSPSRHSVRSVALSHTGILSPSTSWLPDRTEQCSTTCQWKLVFSNIVNYLQTTVASKYIYRVYNKIKQSKKVLYLNALNPRTLTAVSSDRLPPTSNPVRLGISFKFYNKQMLIISPSNISIPSLLSEASVVD